MEIMDITLRDAQQCLWATRMPTSEMIPIARTMDEAGFTVIDLTGGAAIDSSVMFLAEDPFERIRTLSALMTKTPLNFNTRGQSIFRWMQYADDVIEFTLALMRRNGIRSIMVFDALNDIRNLRWTIEVGKRLELYIIGAVVYAISPVHTDEHFVEKFRQLAALGVSALEIKDSGGLLTPERARHLIPAIRSVATAAGIPLQLHSHCSYGHGVDTYLEAMQLGENGVDLMHCASQPLAYGWSLPPVDIVLDELQNHGYSTPVDRAAVEEMRAYFSLVTRRSGRKPGEILPMLPTDDGHHVPGGMMSNLVKQLQDHGQGHRLPEVLEEIARVREELGHPIPVSPMSQYLGAQAVFNVLTGKRYQIVPQEIKQYVLGYYGQVPGQIDPKVRGLIAGNEPGIRVPPGELIEPMMERYRKELAPYDSEEELALKIFYSAQTVVDNRKARLNVARGTTATDAASFLARELLTKKDVEFCEVSKGSFHFSFNRKESAAQTA
jgi:pyruvate/oxaloacetate carboxyltransferase